MHEVVSETDEDNRRRPEREEAERGEPRRSLDQLVEARGDLAEESEPQTEEDIEEDGAQPRHRTGEQRDVRQGGLLGSADSTAIFEDFFGVMPETRHEGPGFRTLRLR